MGRQKDYGPIQLGQTVGLERWQVERGLRQGMIPPAGKAGRWSGYHEVREYITEAPGRAAGAAWYRGR